jgi:hypothetical protein
MLIALMFFTREFVSSPCYALLEKSQNQHILMEDAETRENHLFTPQIRNSAANVDVACQWLDYCRSHHPYCHARPSDTTRVQINDFFAHKVVQRHSEDCLRLSCVWGSVRYENPRSTRTSILPKTIRDAVYLFSLWTSTDYFCTCLLGIVM